MDGLTYDSEVNPLTFRSFVIHYNKELKKREDRDKAKKNIKLQINKIKGISLEKKETEMRAKLEKEFEELEKRIHNFLQKEKEIMGKGEISFSEDSSIRNKILELEKKIKKPLIKEKEPINTEVYKQKIIELENNLNKLKNDKRVDKSYLENVKKKIDSLKIRLSL